MTTIESDVLGEAVRDKLRFVGLTVGQYDSLIKDGNLAEDTSTELIEGLIVKKDRSAAGENPMTIGDRHRTAVLLLAELNPLFKRKGCFIQSQQPVSLPPRSEPEPDLSVVVGSVEGYRVRKPQPVDIISVIEVADASLKRDLGIKLKMYARAGIAEYIVVDLVSNQVLVHHKPTTRGAYAAPKILRAGDTLAISAGGGKAVEIAVKTFL